MVDILHIIRPISVFAFFIYGLWSGWGIVDVILLHTLTTKQHISIPNMIFETIYTGEVDVKQRFSILSGFQYHGSDEFLTFV